ncbi:MAG TPA: acyl-CoA dehydrogenase family protein [Pseudonocardiaceae bacterium]
MDKGSAAVELTAPLTSDGDDFLLHGQKRYVGNAAHAELGVAFCRWATGPVGIEPMLIETADPGFKAEVLPTIGLRGARISAITLDGVRVRRDQVLGFDRRPTRRGLVGAIRTLQRVRPVLAGIALGLARAALDHAGERRSTMADADQRRLDAMRDAVAAARHATTG